MLCGVRPYSGISRGGDGRKCVEHEPTGSISFSRPKKENNKKKNLLIQNWY